MILKDFAFVPGLCFWYAVFASAKANGLSDKLAFPFGGSRLIMSQASPIKLAKANFEFVNKALNDDSTNDSEVTSMMRALGLDGDYFTRVEQIITGENVAEACKEASTNENMGLLVLANEGMLECRLKILSLGADETVECYHEGNNSYETEIPVLLDAKHTHYYPLQQL